MLLTGHSTRQINFNLMIIKLLIILLISYTDQKLFRVPRFRYSG